MDANDHTSFKSENLYAELYHASTEMLKILSCGFAVGDADLPPATTMDESPVFTYHLHTESKTLSHLTLSNNILNSTQSSYDIHYRSHLPHPHRGPDIFITQHSSAAILGRAGFHHNSSGHIAFYPRARTTVNTSLQPGHNIPIEMAAPDFENWTFTFRGTRYIWRVKERLACLELLSQDISPEKVMPIISRFTYGKVGDGVVGTLEIWEKGLLDLQEDTRKESTLQDFGGEAREESILGVVIMSYLIVVKHLEGLGKAYESEENAGSVATTPVQERRHKRTMAHDFRLFYHNSSPN